MLTAALVMLLCGTGLMMVVGYLNGYAMNVETADLAPADLFMLRTRQRFYVASMGLAAFGVLLLAGTIALSSETTPGASKVWGALTAALGYAVLGSGMAVCHWTGVLWHIRP